MIDSSVGRAYVAAPVAKSGPLSCMHHGLLLTLQGTRALTASSDKTCRLWDMDTGDCLQVMEDGEGGRVGTRANVREGGAEK